LNVWNWVTSIQFFLSSPSFHKINKFVSKAAKQFLTFNKHNFVPNFLVWVSFDFQLNHRNFIEAFNGYIELPGGEILRDLRNERYRKRVESAWNIIDAHIWLQASHKNDNIDFYEKTYFIRNNNDLRTRKYINMLKDQ